VVSCAVQADACRRKATRASTRKADEGGIPGRIATEENAARRRLDGAASCWIPGAGH
jgi:hypothetical protein